MDSSVSGMLRTRADEAVSLQEPWKGVFFLFRFETYRSCLSTDIVDQPTRRICWIGPEVVFLPKGSPRRLESPSRGMGTQKNLSNVFGTCSRGPYSVDGAAAPIGVDALEAAPKTLQRTEVETLQAAVETRLPEETAVLYGP